MQFSRQWTFFREAGSFLEKDRSYYIITPHTWNMDPFYSNTIWYFGSYPIYSNIISSPMCSGSSAGQFQPRFIQRLSSLLHPLSRFPDPNPAILYSAAGAGEWAASGWWRWLAFCHARPNFSWVSARESCQYVISFSHVSGFRVVVLARCDCSCWWTSCTFASKDKGSETQIVF